MGISSGRALRAFLFSGVTVGLRSVVSLLVFVLIVRGANSDAVAN